MKDNDTFRRATLTNGYPKEPLRDAGWNWDWASGLPVNYGSICRILWAR